MVGEKILNYEIKSLLGEGGMGDVYLGEHVSIGRKVAIKILKPELAKNPEIRKRFKNEAKVMAQLQHPNVVQLYDYHEDDKGLYLIIEYVEGIELADKILELDAPFEIDPAKVLMIKILEAFKYAHANGVVHRDVKPANILITKTEDVKVLDFGIAKIVGDEQFNLTKSGSQVGTAYYMSPEQVKAKEVDLRSDIYSLGVTFYEMLTGYCPYKSLQSEYDISNQIVNEPLKSLVDTMGEQYSQVWKVIEKATEKDPNNRFKNCGEMIQKLKEKNQPASSSPVSNSSTIIASEVPSIPKSKNIGIYIAIASVLLLVIGLIIIPPMLSSSDESSKGQQSDSETQMQDGARAIVARMSASSTMNNYAGMTYRAENAIDGVLNTWWSPTTKQSGSKWLKYDFGSVISTTGINIHAGSHYLHFVSGSKDYGNIYTKNLRIKRAKVEFSDGSTEYIDLADVDRIQNVYFQTTRLTSYIKITPIDNYDQYGGWDDYCISELEIIRGK